MLQPRPTQREVLILGNGPSLKGRPWATIPREIVFVLGVNQSWREVPDADAHFSNDGDQFDFEKPTAAGFGGRDYYARLHDARAVFHTGAWPNFGVQLDRHDAVVFGRHPFRRRHRGAAVPPPLRADGGVALKVDPAGSAGSSAYIALQMAAALPFERIWFAGLDMGAGAVKFDGAVGWAGRRKEVATTEGAWSNSEKHDNLWRQVPEDVLARVRVIGPSATKVLTVVDWPWFPKFIVGRAPEEAA